MSESTTPRVARSVDDLRVGQWVACWMRDYTTDARTGRETWQDWSRVVILSDPPARDWLVPATQIMDAVRAVLDAAREVEHE